MRRILIASHGDLAEGMKRTLHFFAGENVDVTAICAYIDEESLQTKLDKYFINVKQEDEVLVFTDLLGGSVNQAMLPYMQREHIHIIAGVFLGIMLELIYKEETYLTKDMVQNSLNKSKESIIYMNNYTLDLQDIDE